MSNGVGRIENLRSIGTLGPEERKALTVSGGRASGIARKRKSQIRSALQDLLCADALALGDEDEAMNALRSFGIPNPTMAETVAVMQLLRARRGDVESARFVRDSSGEVPTAHLEIAGDPGKPIAGIDLSQLSDDELRVLAERCDDGE